MVRIPRSQPERRRRLHVCAVCGWHFVVPAAWAPHGAQHFWIRLRCGECGTVREVVIDDAAAQRYDRDLARGMGEIALTLKQLEHAHMAQEAEVLAAALRLDLIDAGDFAR